MQPDVSKIEYKVLGSVNSNNQYEYPQNGEQNGYYYEYKSVSYSQGTYISDVESNNPNTYPENGRASDGYWYVKQVV